MLTNAMEVIDEAGGSAGDLGETFRSVKKNMFLYASVILDTQYQIYTGDANPIWQAPRRLSMATWAGTERIIQNMEQDGVIETSKSPWAFLIVVVKKRDDTTRFCIDYRGQICEGDAGRAGNAVYG
ncbi:hypothetical protein Trydic_g5501 [Trypoxylus dichotomus]